jgi:hypothetical protein
MTQKHCYLLVEGQQDVLFIGRIFQTLGVPDVQNVDDISSVWTPLIKTDRLTEHRGLIAAHRRGLDIHQLFNGVCFQSATHSIVVRKVGGRGKEFRQNLESIDLLLDGGLADPMQRTIPKGCDKTVRPHYLRSNFQYLKAKVISILDSLKPVSIPFHDQWRRALLKT